MMDMGKIPAILPNCEIRAVQGAVVSLGVKNIPIVGLSSERNCLTFQSKFIKQKLFSPATDDADEFLGLLIDKKTPKGILLPSNDKSVVLFSQNREKIESAGFLMNIPSETSLKNGFDKWECYNIAKSLNIPCASTVLLESVHDLNKIKSNIPYPFIIKATTLAGGNYIRVYNHDEIDQAYEKMLELITSPKNELLNANLIAQEWLFYDMEDIWCVEAYYDKNGEAVGFYPIKKTRTVIYNDGTYGSRLYAGEYVHNELIVDLTKKMLDYLEWRGFAHLDWVYCKNKNQFYLTEINPRLPGFSYLPYKAGFDMAYYYYADMVCEKRFTKRTKIYPVIYFESLRYPGDLSSSLSAICKGQYDFKKFISSYLRIFTSRKKLVLDLFYTEDIKLTCLNLFRIIKDISDELFEFFFNRMLKR